MQLLDFVSQQRIGAVRAKLAIRVQTDTPNLHDVDTIRRRRRQLDILPTDCLASGAKFVSLQRRNDKDLYALLAKTQRHQLEQKRLARAAHAHDRHVRIGILAAVENVHDADRAVVLVDSQQDAGSVADLKTRERKRRRNA